MKTAVVYEHLRTCHWPSLLWSLAAGRRVFFLHRDRSSVFERFEKKGLLRPLALSGEVSRPPSAGPAATQAFEECDKRFDASKHPLILAMRDLFGSEKIDLAFRWVLTNRLEQVFHSRWIMQRIREALPEGKVLLVPSEARQAQYDAALGGPETPPADRRVYWSPCSLTLGRLLRLKERATVAAYAVCQFFLNLNRAEPRSDETRKVDFLFTIVSPLREFANSIRGVGFLLDGKSLKTDNSLFVPMAPLNAAQKASLDHRGFQNLRVDDWAPPEGAARALKETLKLLRYAVNEPEWVLYAASRLIVDHWQWTGFLKRVVPRKLITYADFLFRHVGRNILLEQAGCETWYYIDTVNTADNFQEDGRPPHPTSLYGYLHYDVLVSWNEKYASYMRDFHRQDVGRHLTVGCLWSEHVRNLRAGDVPSEFPERLGKKTKGATYKQIAVFDTTYHNQFSTTYADGIAFLQGIERLLEDNPDFFVVWKEKKPRWMHRDKAYAEIFGDSLGLERLYDRFSKNPRCFFAGYEVSASEVLAISDLSISFPFTSTAIESLGAGIPAVFFDPNGKHRGTHYDRFPNLVAHDYGELKDAVRFSLREPSPGVPEALAPLDSYRDGRAITRFRAALTAPSRRPDERLFFPPLKTARFLVRPIVEGDVTGDYAAWFSDPVVRRFIQAAEKPQTIESLRDYIRGKRADSGVLMLGLFEKITEKLIGTLKFEPIERALGAAALGVLIGAPEWRGKGAFDEIFKSVSSSLSKRHGLKRFRLGVDRANEAAIKAYRKSGFNENVPHPVAVTATLPGQLFLFAEVG